MKTGATGIMSLAVETEPSGSEIVLMQHLEASGDGRVVMLVETGRCEWGVQRQTRYSVSVGELIDLLKKHGQIMRRTPPA